jgi:8-oxo-dGTP pyrophosphatase MutT (NUDIX family)
MSTPKAPVSAGIVPVRRVAGGWRMLILRAYRNWDFPKGRIDPGEAPLAAAKRELAEEIGREAEHWKPILQFHPSVGYSNEKVHLFAATGLRDSDVQADPGERIEIVPWPLSDLDAAIAQTDDAKTLLGLSWLRDQRR